MADPLETALTDERLALADLLESLTDEQWEVPTLCSGWTVHDMAAHLLVPIEGLGRHMITAMVRGRGNPGRVGLIMTARFATLDRHELVRRIRAGATHTEAPPVVGLLGPYSDSLIHGEDLRVPLGLDDDRPADRWTPTLDFLVSRRGRVGFVPGRVPSLTLAATDTAWTHGTGPRVEGPAAALALALTGRPARTAELTGPGSEVLRSFAAG